MTSDSRLSNLTLRELVNACPLGWYEGRLIWHKETTDADVIQWLKQLRVLAGLDPEVETAT